MELWELELLTQKYQTQAFNCHSPSQFPLRNDLTAFVHQIYIENTDVPFNENELGTVAGPCVDFSHLENDRHFRKGDYKRNLEILKKLPAGCGHIGPIKKRPWYDPRTLLGHFDTHFVENLSELDYLNQYCQFFPPILALEVENSLEEQLQILNYFSSKICTSKT
jgi:hypothetical protein